MRTLLIAGVLGIVVLARGLRRLERELGFRPGSRAEGGHLRDQPDREEVPRVDVQEGHRRDDEPLGPERDLHVRPRADGHGEGADQAVLAGTRRRSSPRPHWVSDHPAYKLEVTVNGDRGTLHFECHFIDVNTGKVAAVTAADLDVARIDGRWLITNMVGRTTELSLSPCRNATCRSRTEQPRTKRRLLSPADHPLVRAVGRVPAGVHTKLLVAFVGTALLVVAVGLLGLRLLGQSNDRVVTLGALQERASPTASSAATPCTSACCSPRTSAGTSTSRRARPDGPRRRRPGGRPGDRERRRRDPALHVPRHSRVRAAAGGRALPVQDPGTAGAAVEGDAGDHPLGPTSRGRDALRTRPSSWPSTSTSSPPSSPMPRRRGPTR